VTLYVIPEKEQKDLPGHMGDPVHTDDRQHGCTLFARPIQLKSPKIALSALLDFGKIILTVCSIRLELFSSSA
jgi:hypothetical protein